MKGAKDSSIVMNFTDILKNVVVIDQVAVDEEEE